jgi:hypothetical protein
MAPVYFEHALSWKVYDDSLNVSRHDESAKVLQSEFPYSLFEDLIYDK